MNFVDWLSISWQAACCWKALGLSLLWLDFRAFFQLGVSASLYLVKENYWKVKVLLEKYLFLIEGFLKLLIAVGFVLKMDGK